MAKRSGKLKELRGLRSDEELSSHPTHMSCVPCPFLQNQFSEPCVGPWVAL